MNSESKEEMEPGNSGEERSVLEAEKAGVTINPEKSEVLDEETEFQESLTGWGVAFGSFLVHFAVLGVQYSYGIFTVSFINEFGISRADASLAITLAIGSFFMTGIVAGRLGDKYGIKPVVLAGTIGFCLCLILESVVYNFVIIQVIQFFIGVSGSLCYWPAVTVIGQWFNKNRAAASGLAVFGSGIGQLVISALGTSLIEQYGWRTTMQIFAGSGTALLFVAIYLLKRRLPKVSSGGFFAEYKVLYDRLYQTILLSAFLFQVGYYIPFSQIYVFATDNGLSDEEAGFVLGFIGVGSACGRILLSIVADKLGLMMLFRFSLVGTGICLGFFIVCTTLESLTAFAFIFGFMSGGFISLVPIVVGSYYGFRRLGGILGFVNIAMIAPSLAASPLAGYIYDSTGSYAGAFIPGSIAVICSGLVLFLLPSFESFRAQKEGEIKEIPHTSNGTVSMKQLPQNGNIEMETA